MLVVLAGWKKTMEVLPAALVAGVSYAITCYLVSHLRWSGAARDSFLLCVDVVPGGLPAILEAGEHLALSQRSSEDKATALKYSTKQIVKAWSPWLVLMVVMGIWGIPAFKKFVLNELHWFVNISAWPWLDGVVFRAAPIVASRRSMPLVTAGSSLPAAGTAMMISSVIAMVFLASDGGAASRCSRRPATAGFCAGNPGLGAGHCVSGNYSGMSYSLGLAFASYTGRAFRLHFSPVIGWLGVFLTGLGDLFGGAVWQSCSR